MANERPNIVFIFADDWGWGDLGCYGHPRAQTPHLDQLARDGRLFSQFYVCSGVCSPSRAAVMTGRFPARFAIHGHFAQPEMNERRAMPNWLDPQVPTLPRLLQAEGYRTGHFGKWHLGHGRGAPEPYAYGIDECTVNVGNGPQLSFGRDTGPDFVAANRHRSSEVIVDQTIGFIERTRGAAPEQPFYVNVWLNDTHAILHPSEEQLDPYRELVPEELRGLYRGAPAIYYAALTNADRQLGRLFARLDELGIADNTIVIFSADNGPEDILIGNASHSGVGSPGPFRGRKRSLYEGGVRTPFIVRWPAGMQRCGVVDDATVLCGVDLLPTLCAAAGVAVPAEVAAELDGEDQSAALGGPPVDGGRTRALLWQWRFRVTGHPLNQSPMLAIRDGHWKLLLNPDRDRVELYDVPADPMELRDQAGAHAAVVDGMAAQVLEWAATLPPGPFDAEAGSNAYPWPREGGW